MFFWMALALQGAVAGGARECQAAVGPFYDGADVATLAQQVDGKTIRGAAGLARLRAGRGDRLLVINGGAFAGADLRQARLRNICFVGSDLSRSDWRGAAAPGIGFIDANLEGARLAGARLHRILLRQARLKNVDAAAADLSGGRMDGGWDGSVENLRLDRADLTGFRFECGITIGDGCPLEGDISLAGANLTQAHIADYFRFSAFAGARIDRTVLGLAQLPDIADADLQGPLWLSGGDTIVEISPADYRALRPHIAAAEPSGPASFDCAAARSAPERAICAPDAAELRELDRRLGDLYRRARAAAPGIEADQLAWLRRRNACGGNTDCLSARYRERIDALHGRLGPPEWAVPGAFSLFVRPDLHVAGHFRQHPLYRRLLPVLIGRASARLVVRVAPDGGIEAGGDAVGGNAHLCSLSADALRFDPRTGWYSGPHQDDADTPPALRGRPMPVLRFTGDTAQVYRDGQSGFEGSADPRPSDYAGCGARAYFGDLVRVPVTPAQADALLRGYREDRSPPG
jgi:uncharacterized protein YjbI with pentapeptide repeats